MYIECLLDMVFLISSMKKSKKYLHQHRFHDYLIFYLDKTLETLSYRGLLVLHFSRLIVQVISLFPNEYPQMYSLNRARVVYLHKREQSQPMCRFTSVCLCGHALPKKLKYCSIICKVILWVI